MNKKAGVLEIIIHPVFVTVIALGFVLLTILNVVHTTSESSFFDKKVHAVDIAFLIDAVQSLPREINVFVNYPLNFGVDIKSNVVNVFEKDVDDGVSFFYNINPDFKLNKKSFSKSDFQDSDFVISRSGKNLDFFVSENFHFNEAVFCPIPNSKLKLVEVFSSSAADILEKYSPLISKTGLPSGDADLLIDFMNIPKGIRIFVPPDSSPVSCYIFSEVLKQLPGVSVAVVPTVPVVLHSLDDRNILSNNNSMVIGFSNNIKDSVIADIVFNGLIAYGL